MGDRWFPTLNHLCVYLGHALATLWVWLIARRLDFHPAARLTAATIHYVSPAILGTLLSIDSLNQTYASCWGLAAHARLVRLFPMACADGDCRHDIKNQGAQCRLPDVSLLGHEPSGQQGQWGQSGIGVHGAEEG